MSTPRTHGVGPETAVLPAGWEGRLVMVSNANTRFVRGWCFEVHDLAISKLVAGREKDLDFVGALGRNGMARGEILRARLAVTELDGRVRELVAGRIGRCFGG